MSAEDDDRLLSQAQLWLQALVPLTDVDPEATTIRIKVKGASGEQAISSVSLADTMSALQIRNGKALTGVGQQLAATSEAIAAS